MLYWKLTKVPGVVRGIKKKHKDKYERRAFLKIKCKF